LSAGKSFKFNGLRAVALFEAVKSLLVLVVGFGLFSLINHDVGAAAEKIVRRLHLNPFNKYPRIFLEAAHHVTNASLWVLASLAIIDSVTRLVVAYGLWHDRYWAKWLGVVTAGIYLPLEIYELYIHFTSLKLVTFVTNIVIVIYLGLALYYEKPSNKNVGQGRVSV